MLTGGYEQTLSLGVYHIQFNVTDFEWSLVSYQRVGSRIVPDLGRGPDPANAKGLRVADGICE